MQADSYLALLADNTALVKSGRVELGQGSTTGLLLLAAEELDMDVGQLVFVRQDTNVTPGHGRHVRVELDRRGRPAAPSRLRGGAASCCSVSPRRELGVPVANLTVVGGVVSGGGRASATASCSGAG